MVSSLPSHFLDRISPIFSRFFPVFCAFSPSRRGGSNEPQARTQGQETAAPGPRVPNSALRSTPRRLWARLAHTHLEQCAGISSTFNKQALVVIQFAGTTQNGVSPDGFFTNPDTHEQESLCLMSNTKVRSSPASSRLCPRLLIKSVRACVVRRRITSAASVWCSSPATRTPTAP